MRLLGRARPPELPEKVAQVLGVSRRDRVLAWSPLVGGGAAVATIGGLKVLTPEARVIDRAWVDIDRAIWDAGSSTIAVWFLGQARATPLEVQEPSRLPVVIRERFQASLLLAGEILVPGGRVRIALRRGPSGEVSSQVFPPPGTNLDDPEVAANVRRGINALRAEAGVEPEPESAGGTRDDGGDRFADVDVDEGDANGDDRPDEDLGHRLARALGEEPGSPSGTETPRAEVEDFGKVQDADPA